MSRILILIFCLFTFTRASTDDLLIIEMTTFFSDVYFFVTKDPNALISEEMFNQIKNYQRCNLTLALEAIGKFCNVRFAYLFVKVWEFGLYDKFEPNIKEATQNSRDIQILTIFLYLNGMLRRVIFRQYLNDPQKSRNFSSDKRFTRAIVSILKRVDQSDKIIRIYLAGLDKVYSLTTTEITEIIFNFAQIIEDDCVNGFKKAAREFIIAAYNYGGNLPNEFSGKTRILALFMACRYFNQSFVKLKYYSLIKVEDWHPMMLAFLLGIRLDSDDVYSLFSNCTDKSSIINILETLGKQFEKDLSYCGFKLSSYPKSVLMHTAKALLTDEETWLNKTYAKLYAYSMECHFKFN
jgi:hypothetical protein